MFGVVRTVGQLVVLLATMTTISLAAWQDVSERVSQLRSQLALEGVSSEVRSRLLDELLVARAELIQSQASNPEILFWRTAQAEDAVLQGLSINALELIVRHGLPGQVQEEIFDRYVQLALKETRDIEQALPAAIQAAPAGSDLLARLEALRDSRLPMLRGIALVLGSERNLVSDRASSLQEGVRLLQIAVPTLRGNDRTLAHRQLALGRLSLGEEDEAQSMLESIQREDMSNHIEKVGIRLALNEVTARADGSGMAAGRAQLVAATNNDPLERLLLIEQAARYWILTSRDLVGSEDPEEQKLQVAAESNAVECFLLLHPENGGLQMSNPTFLDLLIEERLGRLDVVDLDAEHIPDSVRIAKAVRMAGSEETIMQARALLLPMLDKPGMIPRSRSRMLAMLVGIEVASGMDASASEHAIEWSKIALIRDEAFEAADLAIIHAIRALQASPDEKTLQPLLEQAMDNMLENFADHPKVDRWRLKAGELASQNGQDIDAMSIFASIPAESSFRAEAISKQAFLIVQTTMNQSDRAAAIAAARNRLNELQLSLDDAKSNNRRAAKQAQVGLDLCRARIDLLDGNPVQALELLTRPGMDSIEPELAVYLYTARVDAAMETGRVAAIEAVIDDLPFTVDAAVVQTVLPGILTTPGSPLPLDELQDPVQRAAALKLAIVLETSSEMNIAHARPMS